MNDPITGGCNCGGVRYEISAPLTGALYCHCKRCQRRSGTAASPQAQLEPDSFRLTSGDDLLNSWTPEGGGEKVFCSVCGSAVFARDPDTGEVAGVRMGTFDHDPGVRPSARQYVAYAAVWEPIPDDGLPRFQESRSAAQ